MFQTNRERHMRLAKAAAAAWVEVHDFMAKDPDMNQLNHKELLLRLQSAVRQADLAYWENVDAEAAQADSEEL